MISLAIFREISSKSFLLSFLFLQIYGRIISGGEKKYNCNYHILKSQMTEIVICRSLFFFLEKKEADRDLYQAVKSCFVVQYSLSLCHFLYTCNQLIIVVHYCTCFFTSEELAQLSISTHYLFDVEWNVGDYASITVKPRKYMKCILRPK